MTFLKDRSCDDIGRVAEFMAATFLRLKGYRILSRRYKTKVGEIDLIAKRGSLIVFVEVKKRQDFLCAGEAIHKKNQERIINAARHFMAYNPKFYRHNYQVRFDAVLLDHFFRPIHIKQAFYQ